MPEKNSARFDDDPGGRTTGPDAEDPRSEDRGSAAARGSEVRAPQARAAEEHRAPERPAHDPRRPQQRTDEQRTDERRTGERRAEERRTDRPRGGEYQGDGNRGDGNRGDDRPGAGPAPALRKPAAEPAIPRQPTGSDVLDSRPGNTAVVAPGAGAGPAGPDAPRAPGLWLETAQVQRLSAQWRAVQTGFVDDPRAAVEQADDLVGKAADLLAESVGENRRRLRGAGGPTEDSGIPTEELRLAMREYRTLLDRLLAS
ncbi:hypothetical protein [Kitasatospora herbaricolor]|uniref:Uncharacterized protein n=1 Tax=Kitasatospora herbaricolor TaxID=68217 RepID=A0ABZ1W113_9ACTN|nr:hypothetical protein [Kitasatospora herbaricolor]